MIRELHRDDHFRVEHEPSIDVHRVARSERAFADLAETERAVERALSSVPAGAKLLLDLRDDSKFETFLKVAHLARFARVAILVGKPAEVQRIKGYTSATVAAFDNEDHAFDHLLG